MYCVVGNPRATGDWDYFNVRRAVLAVCGSASGKQMFRNQVTMCGAHFVNHARSLRWTSPSTQQRDLLVYYQNPKFQTVPLLTVWEKLHWVIIFNIWDFRVHALHKLIFVLQFWIVFQNDRTCVLLQIRGWDEESYRGTIEKQPIPCENLAISLWG